jgi:hypothetical protein
MVKSWALCRVKDDYLSVIWNLYQANIIFDYLLKKRPIKSVFFYLFVYIAQSYRT